MVDHAVNNIIVRAPNSDSDNTVIETICPFDSVTVKAILFNDKEVPADYSVALEKCEDTGEVYPVLIADCRMGDIVQRVRFVSYRKLIIVEASHDMYCQLKITYQPLVELVGEDIIYYCCFSKPTSYEDAKFGLACSGETVVISNGEFFIYLVGTNPVCRSLTDPFATPSPSLSDGSNSDSWVMLRTAPGTRLTEASIRQAFNKHFSNPV